MFNKHYINIAEKTSGLAGPKTREIHEIIHEIIENYPNHPSIIKI